MSKRGIALDEMRELRDARILRRKERTGTILPNPEQSNALHCKRPHRRSA